MGQGFPSVSVSWGLQRETQAPKRARLTVKEDQLAVGTVRQDGLTKPSHQPPPSTMLLGVSGMH
jgi:hypothetical protein